MKTAVKIIVLLFLGVLLYSQYNTPSKDEGSYKSITPDSVYNKDGTAQQNDIAYKGGMPILTREKSTHYLNKMKVDSTNATAMFLNKITGKNEIIKVNFSSKPAFSWTAIIFSSILFVLMLSLIFTAIDNMEDWNLILLILTGVAAIMGLFWLYNFVEIENDAVMMMLYSILFSSGVSFLITIAFDNSEKNATIVFIGLNLILYAIFFLYINPGAKMFFVYYVIALAFNLLILLIAYLMAVAEKNVEG